MKKMLTAALMLCLIGMLSMPCFAAGEARTEHVSITYRSIRITLDGVTLNPCDAEGNAAEPFILNGTTYLPVRAIAGALGLDVSWNGESSTVSLTSGGTSTLTAQKAAATNCTVKTAVTYRGIRITLDGTAVSPTDGDGNAVEPFLLNGTTYLPVRAIASALGLRVSWDGETSTVALEAPKTLQPPTAVS